jgi:hypothetical protein
MPHEHYCLDDVSLVGWLDGSTAPTVDIHALVDSLDRIAEDGEPVLSPNTLEFVPIGKGLQFFDLYSLDFSESDQQYGVDRDARERLIIARAKLTDAEATPALDASLECDGQANAYAFAQSGTAAIVFGPERHNAKFALLTIRGSNQMTGCHLLRSKVLGLKSVFVFRDADNRSKYIRWLMNEGAVTEEDFFLMWVRAFPRLRKSDDLSFNRLKGSYQTLRPEIIDHLSFLNDGFMDVCKECKMHIPEVMRVAKARYGIDFSNESPNTRRSEKKMRKRVAHFSGVEVTCEMHTKLDPTVNRIHFHPPIEEGENQQIFVGIFVDHLET